MDSRQCRTYRHSISGEVVSLGTIACLDKNTNRTGQREVFKNIREDGTWLIVEIEEVTNPFSAWQPVPTASNIIIQSKF